ncbi:MAG: deoxyribonuclease V [Chloroflexi bacterium]|nr:MAG: deoxyribonuclease V [Chloroflexota bacterium]RLC95168.1 MAG: deoxyribonuclease V [Chloroflexota bacterium]
MRVQELHPWDVSPEEAEAIQRRMASMVSQKNCVEYPRHIAGVDVSVYGVRGVPMAAAVVLTYPDLKMLEVRAVEGEMKFPYRPGLLSFREAPLILAACEQLSTTPDLIMVDGQGFAHPRRLGLACHIGVILDVPTIGCAKSILCGKHAALGEVEGNWTELIDDAGVIGAAVRTKAGAKPIYVSVGHKVDLTSAVSLTLKCCRGRRLPEPTRMAHLAAAGVIPAT